MELTNQLRADYADRSIRYHCQIKDGTNAGRREYEAEGQDLVSDICHDYALACGYDREQIENMLRIAFDNWEAEYTEEMEGASNA